MGNCARSQNTSDDNHLHNSSIARAGSYYPERNPSAGTRLKELQRQFKSDIKLDLQIITRFPTYKNTAISGYDVSYKVDYGRFQGKWSEQNITGDTYTSQCLEIEYIFGDKKQEILVEIDATAQLSKANSKRTRSIEENRKLQHLKMIVAFDLHQAITEQKAIAASRILFEPINIKEFDIQLIVNERKTDKMQKVRFEAVYIPKSTKGLSSSQYYIQLYEQRNPIEQRKLILKDQPGEYSEQQLPHFEFPMIQFTSGMLNMDPSNQTRLILSIFEKVQTKDKKTGIKSLTESLIGECSIKIPDLQLMTLNDMLLPILNEKGKQKGLFKLKNCTVRNFYTFLDLYVTNDLKLVPVIAVDYSLANLTFDESCYCLHTLKQGQPNDYMDALRLVYRSYEKFSEFMLSYGFGARTIEGEGPACNLFSMTGDFTEPFIESEEGLIEAYKNTLKSVKLALPVQFRDIIKAVCDIAQIEFGTADQIKKIKNYYVLVIIMAGCIDDFEQSLNQILRAAHLPVSVKIIKIGPSQEENDSNNLRILSEKSFAECERTYIDIMSYDNYKKQGQTTTLLAQQLEYDMIKDIPAQVEKFFELQQFENENTVVQNHTSVGTRKTVMQPVIMIEQPPVTQQQSDQEQSQQSNTLQTSSSHLNPLINNTEIVSNMTTLNMCETIVPQFEFTNDNGHQSKDMISFVSKYNNDSHIMRPDDSKSIRNPHNTFMKFQSTLNIIEEEKGGESPKVMGMSPSGGMSIPPQIFVSVDSYNYKKNVYLYIQQERLRLIGEAKAQGIKEQQVEEYLTHNKVVDYYIENLKSRLGIKEIKPPRTRKTLQMKQEAPGV